ncbi:ChaN family lipoprotein [Chromobacterium haemolyticum]|uniref:ChaN family lipoprotein n=1 Tax=Chromobacterium haemolyticum TaxID=394935 RepID=UPI000DEF72FF|nr:ChaN family lipoprotein [Chromobacterium haemolyticum]
MKSIWKLLGIVLLSGCAALPQETDPPGRIVDLRSGEALQPAQLLQRLAPAPRLLVGEKHDNPEHHRIERWLATELAARRPQGSVLLEMLTPSQQAKVEQTQAALRAGKPLSGKALAQAVDWQPGWPWPLYGKLAEHALSAPYPLLAANLDKSEMRTVYRSQAQLSGRASTRPEVRVKLSELIREEHGGQLTAEHLASMLAVQQARDRRMAERLLAAPAPALLIAGAYHAAADIGVPLHVRDLQPQAPLRVLILAEEGMKLDAGQADYVWFVAPVRR